MKNKVLVISGGSRGIGFAAIQLFAAAGYSVVNLSRSQPDFEPLHHVTCDFSDARWADACKPRLDAILAEAEEVVLVHNSGLLESDSIESVTAEAMHRVMQVNVVAPSQLNQVVLPHMQKGSSILYVASTLGEKAVANTCSYVCSKHAMLGLMKASCQDLFGRGIHTAAICPGFTQTEMLSDHVGQDQSVLNAIAEGVSFGRLIAPDEIAETIWFAAQNAVINGAILHANLGQKEY